MSFNSGTAYAESDADDEYMSDIQESSPIDAQDTDASHTDSESPSTEHTPTTYGYRTNADLLPEIMITDWNADECADFIATLGLEQYADVFLENEIVGEALVALQHDDLKAMGLKSVGHRLTILKGVYDVKKAQDVPIEADQYIPLSAEAEAQAGTATMKDVISLVDQLRLRDERMHLLEQDLRRLTEDFRRLREDMLPALRLVKDAQAPLPNGPNQIQETVISPPLTTPPVTGQTSAGLKKSFSTRKIPTGTTPKTSSPSHLQTTHDRGLLEQTLDPSSAAERAVISSSHLAAVNGGAGATSSPSYNSPNIPSPTSPPVSMSGSTLGSRSYRSDQPTPSARSTFQSSEYSYDSRDSRDNRSDKPIVAPRRGQTPAPDTPSGSGSAASVEIFKSFRVSMDDPCYKVLPAALKKYNINAPWDQYALYIVYGDQERCLGLEEKPLILFKQLDKEGKKPMFMLRKTNNAQVDIPAEIPGSAGLGTTSARGATSASGYDPPGGII